MTNKLFNMQIMYIQWNTLIWEINFSRRVIHIKYIIKNYIYNLFFILLAFNMMWWKNKLDKKFNN